ncbi:MAG: Holliday junction branch migration protein RuvA [Desulfuromonadales bacterium]|nr:Holliday junction branch migration protein RuvA [Desulfuromonadales bacterium]
MIALLTGIIAYKSPEYIILDVNGVGYRLFVPFSTYFLLPDEGSNYSLQVHTHVKEDAILLYGFNTPEEKLFFQLLIGVSGIGPKLARDILSNIQTDELAGAIVSGNLTRLSAIPGIGKKTAERLILELKDKILKQGLAENSRKTVESVSSKSALLDDVISALINLGYKEAVVSKAIAETEIKSDATMESLLKLTLKKLMR